MNRNLHAAIEWTKFLATYLIAFFLLDILIGLIF